MASGVHREFLLELFSAGHDVDGTADVIRCALFDNDRAPTVDDTATQAAYNGAGGSYLAATAEVTDATIWPATGIAVTADVSVSNVTNGIVMYDLTADTTNSPLTGTLANVYYAMLYNDTHASDRAMSWHDLSGPQGVTSGTFAVVWGTNGAFRLDA